MTNTTPSPAVRRHTNATEDDELGVQHRPTPQHRPLVFAEKRGTFRP
jgi:hypothetical protein